MNRPRPRPGLEGEPRATSRTLESLHDTQAVFLLMRDCGEDCSAAEARRSSDSRDSPLDIVDEGSVSRRGWVYRDEWGEGDVAEALPMMFAGSALRADGWGGAGSSQSQTACPWLVPSEIRSGPCLGLTHLGQQGTYDCRLHVRLVFL